MKRVLLGLILNISALSLIAQPGCPAVNAGPDVTLPCGTTCTNLTATYFNVGSTTTYDVTQIPYTPPVPFWSGTPVLIGIDDEWSGVISMPFNFCFFGGTYNQFIIGSNGIISFDVSNAGVTNTWTISGSVPANTPSDCDLSIMGVWEDIDPTNLGTTSYQVLGSYPCRTFVICYDSVPYYGDPNSVSPGTCNGPLWASSEIVIYETTNVIEIYNREKEECPQWNGGLAVEGIVNANSPGGFFGSNPPTVAYTVPGRNATQWTAFNDAWRFTPTSSSIVSVKWSHAGATLVSSTGDTAIGNQTLTYSVCPPSSPTVPITTGYTATAIYNRCDGTIVTETDSVNITTSLTPGGGPDQNLGCYAPGLTATMAATAQAGASWTAVASNPSATTITTPTSASTTITGFMMAGNYAYLWGTATCADTVLVIITAHTDAGPDQTVNCAPLPGGGSATMAAVGTGTWTAVGTNPGTAVITNPALPNTTITTFSAVGTYNFAWTSGTCTDTAAVVVTAKPNAGADEAVSCYPLNTTTTMAAAGAGTWTAQAGNPGTATITTPTNPLTTITAFSVQGTYNFVWTSAGCTDTAAVVVGAQPYAGPDQNIGCNLLPGGTATMAATGGGTWAPLPGNPGTVTITTPTSPTTTITTFSAPGAYSFAWGVGTCLDTMIVTVLAKPDAGPDQAVKCIVLPGGSATMAAVDTGTWTAAAGNPAVATIASTTDPLTTISNFTAPGTYNFIWSNGICTDTTAIVVTQLPPPATMSTTPSICTANNGTATVNTTIVTPVYTWSIPTGSGNPLTGLAPGPYTVTVTDAFQCTVSASGTVVLQTSTITVTELSQHNLKCYNDSSGNVYISTADTAGQVLSYTNIFAWSDGSSNQNLTNAPANSYSITVTDQFGCTGTGGPYILTQPPALAADTAVTNPHCFGYADGTATVVNPSGGSGSYYFAWSTNPPQNTQQATGLTAGPYTVSVTDDSLCLLRLPVTLTDPLQITFGAPTIVNPSCFGYLNGFAAVLPQNGIGGYSFAWSNGQTTDPATTLGVGIDTVTVTDGNGCFSSSIVTLVQPPQLSLSADSVSVTCFGYNDGSATAIPIGGTPPYSYLWNNGDTTATAPALIAAAYNVGVTDAQGCTISASTTVIQPTLVTQTLSAVRTNCPDSKDGAIYDTAQGGTGAFTYVLKDTGGNIYQPANGTGVFTGVGAGTYTVMATDQNNCPVTGTIVVPQAPFNYYTDSSEPTSCYGNQYTDGIIRVQGYTIVNGPFQYSIDGGPFQFIPDFFDLSAGPHKVTAQDNFGCDTFFTVVVGEPLPATLAILPGDSTITPGTALQLGTSFSGYPTDSIKGYSWSPVDGLNCVDCASPIAAPYAHQTTYSLIVTYNQGCTDTAFIKINVNGQPPVYIPDAFTPNGDGVNDVWYIFGTGIKDMSVSVYNRWGERVFESDNQSQGWDGRFHGVLQPPALYIYVVQIVYLDDEKQSKQGSLTLIR